MSRNRAFDTWPLIAAMSVLSATARGEERSLGPGAPALATARYEAGIARYRAGDFAGAAAEFRIALSAMPGSAILAYNLPFASTAPSPVRHR
jgi:TolA-binding protein